MPKGILVFRIRFRSRLRISVGFGDWLRIGDGDKLVNAVGSAMSMVHLAPDWVLDGSEIVSGLGSESVEGPELCTRTICRTSRTHQLDQPGIMDRIHKLFKTMTNKIKLKLRLTLLVPNSYKHDSFGYCWKHKTLKFIKTGFSFGAIVKQNPKMYKSD
jgi:hypothetical protein